MSTHPNCPICGGGGTGSTHPCACAPDNASLERLHPTPTPTPWEVLADTLRALDFEYGAVLAKPKAEYLRQADACLAALAATGDAPLAAERVAELLQDAADTLAQYNPSSGMTVERTVVAAARAVNELAAAYTALAAQLAALRAERDKWSAGCVVEMRRNEQLKAERDALRTLAMEMNGCQECGETNAESCDVHCEPYRRLVLAVTTARPTDTKEEK